MIFLEELFLLGEKNFQQKVSPELACTKIKEAREEVGTKRFFRTDYL